MKAAFAVLLAGSLAINAGLCYLLIASHGSEKETGAESAAAAAVPAITPKIDANVWPDLQTQDLRTLVDRLRASGFPPHVIRAIIGAQIQEQHASELKALVGDAANRPFWKSQGGDDPSIQATYLRIRRESEKALNDLLGKDPDDKESDLYNRRAFDYLAPEKAEALRQVLTDYGQRRADIYAQGYSSLTDRTKITALEKELHDTIASVLSPAELFEYDLRTSMTAAMLRDQLAGFNPTEEEFRAIYQLRAPFVERYQIGQVSGASPEERRERMEAERQLTEKIKAALSPERAAIYDRASDFGYAQTSQLVARLGLPESTTESVYAVQKDIERRRAELSRGGAGSREERAAQLAALQQDAMARLTTLLGGARGVEAYKQYGGYWLQTLAPPNTTPR